MSLTRAAVIQSAQGANANGAVMDISGVSELALQVDAAGFTGTVNFEGSNDGTNFYPVPFQNAAGAFVSTATAAGMFVTYLATYPWLRARTSGVSAGTVTVKAFAEE